MKIAITFFIVFFAIIGLFIETELCTELLIPAFVFFVITFCVKILKNQCNFYTKSEERRNKEQCIKLTCIETELENF